MQDASKAKTLAEWQIAYHQILLAEYQGDNLELALGAALNSEYGWWQPGITISHVPGSLEDTIAKVLEANSEATE
jgi:hypothetical protein